MDILLQNGFHGTTAGFSYSLLNRASITLTGRQLRRLLGDLCFVEGCDCMKSVLFSAAGTPLRVLRFEPEAEDHETALELELPPPGPGGV